jgi:ubiquinone/menaquinone biosynthesis C-methylase UbiE
MERSSLPAPNVTVVGRGSEVWSCMEAVDLTRSGLGLRLPARLASSFPGEVVLRLGDGDSHFYGRVRHRTPDPSRSGWVKVGLSVSTVPTGDLIAVEHRDQILGRRLTLREGFRLVRAGASAAAHRAGVIRPRKHRIDLVEYVNDRGEQIRAIENGWHSEAGGTAVIIPPTWGRTKETLLPLALTLVETFRRAGEPIRVIRFDGTNRRGESYIASEYRNPGEEYLRFTFSQAARDISATADYLLAGSRAKPDKIVLVSFSLSSIETRHVLATDRRFAGWVSVVGMADLQGALRTISGGIDYGSGLLRGVTFGRHELVGVIADMDYTGLDAIQHNLGFLEDARREMSEIDVPITWIHGKYDAWMDLERVVESMSCGRTDNRLIIEVPTGHQLRSGQKALETFQLIAEEVSEMSLGQRASGVIPRVSQISAGRSAELSRIPRAAADVRSFWADYLLGRRRVIGMGLLTATAAYKNFMELQISMLHLDTDDRVLDLGAGTGEFALTLQQSGHLEGVQILEMDFIRDALIRARSRTNREGGAAASLSVQCVANLDLDRGHSIPLASGSVDAVLASLLISYVENPGRLLNEIFRVVKPGGRVVVSSMVQDADSMLLFHDGLIEYATDEARASLGRAIDGAFDELVRDFLNDGSRLLDLEERGRFRFWDPSDLRFALGSAGFVEVRSELEFGSPPQAVVVGARRP